MSEKGVSKVYWLVVRGEGKVSDLAKMSRTDRPIVTVEHALVLIQDGLTGSSRSDVMQAIGAAVEPVAFPHSAELYEVGGQGRFPPEDLEDFKCVRFVEIEDIEAEKPVWFWYDAETPADQKKGYVDFKRAVYGAVFSVKELYDALMGYEQQLEDWGP